MNDATERIERTAAQLERAAREGGHVVSGDLRVSEGVAAALLGISPGHLRRLRYHGEIVAYRCGVNGSRVSFRLSAIAEFIEQCADET